MVGGIIEKKGRSTCITNAPEVFRARLPYRLVRVGLFLEPQVQSGLSAVAPKVGRWKNGRIGGGLV